jgi:hypothetical protein
MIRTFEGEEAIEALEAVEALGALEGILFEFDLFIYLEYRLIC